jgi:hypothetical protein
MPAISDFWEARIFYRLLFCALVTSCISSFVIPLLVLALPSAAYLLAAAATWVTSWLTLE